MREPNGRTVSPGHFVEDPPVPLKRRVSKALWRVFMAIVVVAIVVFFLNVTGEGLVPVSR